MTVDVAAAAEFLAASARLLDRRRFELLSGRGDAGPVLAALDAYRNPDGGYGWGLEPDLRSATSQPAGALHALEALVDTGRAGAERALAVCDWLAAATLPDGGLPFALAVPDPGACAPFWVGADPTRSRSSSLPTSRSKPSISSLKRSGRQRQPCSNSERSVLPIASESRSSPGTLATFSATMPPGRRWSRTAAKNSRVAR